VPGVPDFHAAQLALDPDLEETLFEKIADADGQFSDGEDAACGERPLRLLDGGRRFKRKINRSLMGGELGEPAQT
jgi:hypothetical protein